MGSLLWLLQWPIRALALLLVAWLPLGVQLENFGVALQTAVVIGLLGTLLIWPLQLLLALPWLVSSVGGLLAPVSWLYNWLITVVLFGLASWFVPGFRLQYGLVSALLGAVVYAVIASFLLHRLGLDVPLTRVGS